MRTYCNGSNSRTTATVGDTEGLVQVQMAHIGAKLAWLCSADQCIHVCAIDIYLATVVVNDRADLSDRFFKYSVSRGVRHHCCCKRIASFLGLCA